MWTIIAHCSTVISNCRGKMFSSLFLWISVMLFMYGHYLPSKIVTTLSNNFEQWPCCFYLCRFLRTGILHNLCCHDDFIPCDVQYCCTWIVHFYFDLFVTIVITSDSMSSFYYNVTFQMFARKEKWIYLFVRMSVEI